MSLINDALKKAARQRAEEQSDLPPMPGGGRRPGRSGRPMATQSIILIAAAAVALVVVSAVVTGIMVTSKPAPKPAAAEAPAPAAPRAQATPTIAVHVPEIVAAPAPRTPSPTPPPVAAPPAITLAPVAAPPVVAVQPSPAPAPAAAPSVAVQVSPAPALAAPIAVQSPGPVSAPPKGGAEQAQGFVDGLRVSGVRSAGSDSKVLINGHVYKVNDVLDRTLGIRLVRVDADHLTFVDAGGATYLKSL